MLPHIRLLLLASNLLLFIPAAFGASCGGTVGVLASSVAQYPEAQSFCSKSFPQSAAAVTVTVTGSISTVAVSSETVTTTTSLVTSLITTATQTNTITASAIVTTITGTPVCSYTQTCLKLIRCTDYNSIYINRNAD